jgi:hypothetical protein
MAFHNDTYSAPRDIPDQCTSEIAAVVGLQHVHCHATGEPKIPPPLNKPTKVLINLPQSERLTDRYVSAERLWYLSEC